MMFFFFPFSVADLGSAVLPGAYRTYLSSEIQDGLAHSSEIQDGLAGSSKIQCGLGPRQASPDVGPPPTFHKRPIFKPLHLTTQSSYEDESDRIGISISEYIHPYSALII
jgi:hypothetical protein